MQPVAEDFERLANALPQLAWMADSEGSIFWYNQRWYEYTGTTLASMSGWGWRAVHHPDHVEGVVERFRAAFQSGEPWEDTFPLRNSHGQFRWFLSRATPYWDEAGAIIRWYGTNTDITDRLTRDAALNHSEVRYKSLVDSAAAIVWSATPSGEFGDEQLAWSAFTGQSKEERSGWGWLDAVHPDDRATSAEAWTRAVATLRPMLVEYRLRRNDGEWRWMSARAAPVLDGAGSIVEWIGIHSDIHDRRTAEEMLGQARDDAEEANRAKSQFIANMSHELRTPLSAVIGYTEMLEEELEELGEKHLLDDLKKINSNARHLLSLISDVLDISKIEANRMTVYAEEVDVAELLEGVVSTVDSLVRKKGNTLVLDMAPGLGTVVQDQVKLRQVLFNLLGNAAKFTENGTIRLSARREPGEGEGGGWLCCDVADTGIGMTEEQLGRLFERFRQADDSTTRRFGGTGLGLAISKSFVEMLGGTVVVTSREGEGSCFSIRLPAIYRDPAGEVADEAHHTAGAEPETVLVIDDDVAMRDLVARFLTREGFQVRTAGDGRSGLTLARALRPRVILLDVMMPQMDGWSVLAAIKADPELAGTPVVMISFVDEPSLAASLGANAYLHKPVQWNQLKSVMDRYGHPGTSGILVIDDDPGNRQRMQAMLGRSGLPVALAENGARGLEAVARQVPSLILLDLNMPEMDGYAFLEALRARPEWAGIPVVVITAEQIGSKERERLDGKVDRVIAKGSIDLRDLASQLQSYVAATDPPVPEASPEASPAPSPIPSMEGSHP